MATPPTADELARFHRWFAIEGNNRAWQLADQATRTDDENEEMLNAAHASALHWSAIGTELHRARARLLLAHVHAACGNGPLAMRYARTSHSYFVSNETPDWGMAFSHAVMAHAAWAAGDRALHRAHHDAASTAGATIKEAEDKAIFEASFATIPTPQRSG